MLARAKSKIGSTIRRLGGEKALDWADAQNFEYGHAIAYMHDNPAYVSAMEELRSDDSLLSKGYANETFVMEFFNSDKSEFAKFVQHITNKAALDVGPCIFSPLSLWDVASNRFVIEPLYDAVVAYQTKTFGQPAFENIDKAYSQPAENRIDELVGKIDGAVLIRNCIDHSPRWPFILSNIADYMAPGAVLLLWNDLLHTPVFLNGHYDITDDPKAFRRLIENLGFKILGEFQYENSECLNYGCRAVRI